MHGVEFEFSVSSHPLPFGVRIPIPRFPGKSRTIPFELLSTILVDRTDRDRSPDNASCRATP